MKRILLFLLPMIFLFSCKEGYQKKSGQWVWMTYGESFKKNIVWLEPVDHKSFKVLRDKKFAKDKEKVFISGRPIPGADPASFEVIDSKYGYAKDRNHVFIDVEKVIFADPATFEYLGFPYGKDKNRVFCGTLPMDVPKRDVSAFRVVNYDKLMSGMKSTTLLPYFIEFNPEYAWLDTLGIEWVVYGGWGEGEANGRRYKGFKEGK
jgi:hypothetical protein